MSHPRAPDARHRFADLYRAQYADVVRFVQRRVDAGAAEDVVADVFLVVWRRVAELPEDELALDRVSGAALEWGGQWLDDTGEQDKEIRFAGQVSPGNSTE